MGLGGPVWHASVAGKFAAKVRRRLALEVLQGVGVPELQWEQDRSVAYHIRRRLTPEEQQSVGEVKDLRGTFEGGMRYREALKVLPPELRWVAENEAFGSR